VSQSLSKRREAIERRDSSAFCDLVADLRRWIRRIEHGTIHVQVDVLEGCVAGHHCKGERMTDADYERVMRDPGRGRL
jgi:hypothetical protein